MTNAVALPLRDLALLRLLDRTPVTSQLVLKASVAFADEPFRDERRVRERLQALAEHGFVRSFPIAQIAGGPLNWYKLTPAGWRMLSGTDSALPHRSFFEAIPPSRFEHVRIVAETIVHVTVAAHRLRTHITSFHGDGQLVLETNVHRLVPDCHIQLQRDERLFNFLVEIDNSTETLTTERINSIRSKLEGYEWYQDSVWNGWKQQGRPGPRPYFRVVFLTRSSERSNNILWLARNVAKNRDRHLVYAGTQDGFLASDAPLLEPLFNEHDGQWQCLLQMQPTSRFTLTPVRLRPVNVSTLPF